jgi:H+/Cl- antiporter ClcA
MQDAGDVHPVTASQRRRVPQPVIKTRLPSGRGAMEQPNATSDGAAALTPRFWLAVAITGVATGLLGDLMMLLLFNVEHWAFGYSSGSFQDGVTHASSLRRLLLPLSAGLFGGVAWFLLRRSTRGEPSEIDEAVWNGTGELSPRRCIGTSVISEIVIGMGASMGREAAPKLLGGMSGTVTAGWAGLSLAQRRLLVACGAGAGLAAVYNVPLGGAIFTAEVLCGRIALPTVLPALACSWIATTTAWLYLPVDPTYVGIPSYQASASLYVWAILVGPLIGLLATAYIRGIGWLSHHRLGGWKAITAPVVAVGVLGAIGLAYPQLFGNGKGIARDAFNGHSGLLLLLALFLLKPVVTGLCLGSGASGGLFTPVLATGAALGGCLGLAWSHLWAGTPAGAFAMVAAAAMIGAAMQAPLAGVALVLELTHSGFALMAPMIAATVLATVISRWLDGYSIYSARLPAAGGTSTSPGEG